MMFNDLKHLNIISLFKNLSKMIFELSKIRLMPDKQY